MRTYMYAHCEAIKCQLVRFIAHQYRNVGRICQIPGSFKDI